jgi:hypothetical protein
MLELEKKLTETLGTRVHIEQREQGGKIHIDYFSEEDLEGIMNRIISENAEERKKSLLNRMFASAEPGVAEPKTEEQKAEDDRPAREREEGEDIYSVKNFSI